MVDPVHYFIGGDWAPQPWSSRWLSSSAMIFKNLWTCLYVYLSLCIIFKYFITLFIILNFLKNLCEFVLTNLHVLWYSVSIVIGYNSFWDLNKKNSWTKHALGIISSQYFWKLFLDQNTTKWLFLKHWEWKQWRNFPKTKWIQMFCMNLIK